MPPGASGSWQSRTKLAVPSGVPRQRNGGETLSRSHVYRFGISPPCSNAGLVSSNAMSSSQQKSALSADHNACTSRRFLERTAIGPLRRAHVGLTKRSRRTLEACRWEFQSGIIVVTAVTIDELAMTKPLEPHAGSRWAIADS
jgi:hypothetical protein